MLFFQYGLIYPESRSVNFIKFSRAFKFYDAAPRLISKFGSFKFYLAEACVQAKFKPNIQPLFICKGI